LGTNWEIKKDIWKSYSLGDTVKVTLAKLAEKYGAIEEKEAKSRKRKKLENYPSDRNTISTVRSELKEGDFGNIKRLIQELPDMKSFVISKRPDLPRELDNEKLREMEPVFQRRAFTTSFTDETSLLGFYQAISDTIIALRTGKRRDVHNKPLNDIPTLKDFNDPGNKEALQDIIETLDGLLTLYTRYLKSGAIVQTRGSLPTVTRLANLKMNTLRRKALKTFKSIYPDFRVRLPGSSAFGRGGKVLYAPAPVRNKKNL
jgi:hypothetical protein